MRKNLISVLLVFAMGVSIFGATAFNTIAQDKAVRVVMNGQEMNFEGDVAPFTEDDRTLVPFRKLFEALGLKVSWDDATQTAKGEKEGLIIELSIGNTIAKVNGEQVTLDVPAKLVNDRTVVPLRFVAEKSGASVAWNGETNTATITTKPTPDSYQSKVLPIKDNKKAILSITTDDGMPNSMKVFMELMNKHDLKATSAMIVASAEANHDVFKSYVDSGRLEIQNHSMTHKPTGNTEADKPAMEKEIIESGKRLRELFPGQEVLSFFNPGGGVEMNSTTLPMVQQNYIGMRTGTRGYNVIGKINNWYDIKVQGMLGSDPDSSKNVSLDQMNGWLDASIQQGYWLVQMWHGFASEDPNSYRPMDKDLADQHFAYVSEKEKMGEVWVAFFGDALKYVKEYQYTELKLKSATDINRVIGITDTLGNKEIFDYPLTIRSEVASDWKRVNVVQGKNSVDVYAQKEGDIYAIYYDAIPYGGDIVLTKK